MAETGGTWAEETLEDVDEYQLRLRSVSVAVADLDNLSWSLVSKQLVAAGILQARAPGLSSPEFYSGSGGSAMRREWRFRRSRSRSRDLSPRSPCSVFRHVCLPWHDDLGV